MTAGENASPTRTPQGPYPAASRASMLGTDREDGGTVNTGQQGALVGASNYVNCCGTLDRFIPW